MQASAQSIQLTASQAACLDAIKRGLKSKTSIALHVKRDLKTVAAALEFLDRSKLIKKYARGSWQLSRHGQTCMYDVVPDPKRGRRKPPRGRLVPGSAAEQLLAALDRPRRGRELVQSLGVSPQRIHQLVVRFYAEGRVRLGDPESARHIIARSDDPSILLNRDEERILSTLPEEAATTITRMRAVANMAAPRMLATLLALQDKSLLELAGSSRGQALYKLTPDGRGHFQRRTLGRTAAPAPLPVKSERVHAVLSYLAERGEVRTKDLAGALGIAGQSMNALMQYLKRKGLVKKVGRELVAPHAVTDEGREALAEMTRRGSG